jgi:TolB-like protein
MEERLNSRRFGAFTLDLDAEVLLRGGERVPLQPQPMTVLTMLASRPGQLVTRKELQNAVWSDGTFVDFEQGLNWCIKRIREVLGDDAQHPRFIETVPRKGYRFLPIPADPLAPTGRPLRRIVMALVLGVVCLAATGIWTHQPPVTVVILPFDNFTGDPRNEVAAAAATEDVINRLGSVDPTRLKVIDRLTAMKFRRMNECIIHIGQALGAEYVMEGSLQKSHTTAALYRVADNTQLWATAVDAHVQNAPELISGRIASTLSRLPALW